MRIAVQKGHAKAGAILAKKGADCTEKEKAELGQRYTNFILSFPEEEGGESEEDGNEVQEVDLLGSEEEEDEYEEEEGYTLELQKFSSKKEAEITEQIQKHSEDAKGKGNG